MDREKLYLAARYSRRNEMRSLAATLRCNGFAVTSRWLTEDEPLDHKLGDQTPMFYTETARIDLEDIDKADTILFFAEDPLVGTPRGGRHVEFGYALGTGKRMVCIGGHENIFGFLPQVEHFNSIESFISHEVIE